jgi:murein DD-endopeptidase MepM/ murein hydrolase activator NlpD
MIPEKAIKPIVKNGRDNTEIAVGTLIAYGVFPHTNEGIEKAKQLIAESENWLVPSQLPEYYDGIDSDLIVGRDTPAIISIRQKLKEFYKIFADTEDFVDTQVYTPGDKFVDDGKEFVLEIESAQRDALEETSDKIMDAIDEILRKDQEKFEEFKAKEAEELKKRIEKINTPERISQELTIKIPPAHYIQGQSGRWQPEFENDIDHAVYFAGKSPLPKGAKQREVLDWLKSLGLTFEQIHDHREKVLDQIRETISLPGVDEEYPYVYIDAVDQDFVLEDDEDEYEDIEEDLDGLDDLLNDVRNDEEISNKKISENIEEEIVDATEDEEDPMADADVDIQAILDGDEDETKSITEKLTDTINKPKKESSYVNNKKILDSITINFGRIQSTLDIVNKNLEQQNTLIRANIDTQLAVGDLISNQTDLLASKFDLILGYFEKQLQHSEDLDELEKRKASESNLEAQRDAAGSSDFEDLTKKPSGKKRENKIEKYLKGKLTRKLYRKLPKSVRNARQKVRKLQRVPGKAKAKAVSKITSMLPTKGKQAVGTMSKIRGMGRVGRMAGPARYAFAGLEYGERKAEGQSELQAQAGVGSGLAGAGIGAGLVSAGVALLPTAPTGWGAVAAGSLILLGSILGGTVASGAADKITGADKVTGEHETGGLTKPGTAMLHGTEAIINRDAVDMSPLNTLGGIMIASTAEYINSAGAVAAPIAPSLRGVSTQMARQYDVPATLAQTNVGGTLPKIDTELKKVREKRIGGNQEEFSGQEKQLLETSDEDNFAEKLLKMIDPDEKFLSILQNINNRNPLTNPDDYDGTGIDGNLEGKIVNPMEGGVMEDYAGAKFGAPRGKRTHKGRDIIGPAGMKVVSALPGTVTSIIHVGDLPGGGKSMGIYVKHSNGMETRYLHVHPSVKVGDQVKAGQQIGKITEMDDISSVAHLHFEVIVNGRHVDPEPIVNGSLKMSDIAAGKVPGLSVKAPKNPAEIESHSGTEVSKETPPASPPSSMATSVKASNPPGALAPGQRPDLALNREQFKASREARESGIASGLSGQQLEQHVASSVMKLSQKPSDISSQISAPPRQQKSTEIASLSNYNEDTQNNVMVVNNQSSPTTAMPSSGGIEFIQMSGSSSSELLKNLMLQRLNA